MLAYNKTTKKTDPIGENVFDFDHTTCFLIGSQNDTVFYVCTDEGNASLSYYSFDIKTGRKQFLYSPSILRNADGFLGLDQIFGMQLVTNDLFQVMRQQGKTWINKSGVHTVNEMCDLLRKTDAADKWGVYDEMDKIAGTDESLWFINDYAELIQFDLKTKAFCRFPVYPVQDFFLTKDIVYYVYRNKLYCADLSGDFIRQIADFAPFCIRKTSGVLFVKDSIHNLFRINDKADNNCIKKIKLQENAEFAVDDNAIYILSDNEFFSIEWEGVACYSFDNPLIG